MDEVEFMDRVDAVIESMSSRVPPDEARSMSEDAYAGEYDEVFDLLLALVHRRGIPIYTRERDELQSLMNSLSLPVADYNFINDGYNILASANVVEERPGEDSNSNLVPVMVHENPDFEQAVSELMGVHVDLPARCYEPFVDHFTTAVGVGVELNLQRTNPDQYTRGGTLRQPSERERKFVFEQVDSTAQGSVWGGGVLLRGFEQWWLKGRSDAETLLAHLPGLLSTASGVGKTLHIALADLSTPTVHEVLEKLRQAQLPPTATEPVAVFHYPPM